jgi:hypothetical protein
MQNETLQRYFDALRNQDWRALDACLTDDVHRTGPYLDHVQGKRAYVEFLSAVIPTLKNYELNVSRIRELADGSALVELSESLDMNGLRREIPEVLLFDFDEGGSIARVDVYIKQPPRPSAPDEDATD